MRDRAAVAAGPVRVGGLFEAHLGVSDLDRSVAFYRDILGLSVAFEVAERGATFLWVAGRGEAMLGLWSLGSAPIGLISHVAFTASVEDVLGACARLRSLGVTPLSFSGTETDEPSVIAWMPAAAVYFRDPDGHLLELLAMLDAPADPQGGILPWSEWAAGTHLIGSHVEPVHVERHTGSRSELRALFAMAEDSATRLDSYLDAGQVLVALAGHRVVGHLQLVDGADAQQSEITNMAVAPAHRGRGIGRALIHAAIELAREERRSTLVVATAAADIGNLRFYQRAGFRMRSVERDAFTAATGYSPHVSPDGIDLRDRVWLDLDLGPATPWEAVGERRPSAA